MFVHFSLPEVRKMNFRSTLMLLLLPALLVLHTACSDPETKKEMHFQKAMVYMEQEETPSAILELKNALQIDPKYAEAHYQLGLLYLKEGNPRSAIGELQRAASLDPDNLDALTKVAEFHLISRKKEESRSAINKVLAKAPDYPDALALLANLEFIEGNFDLAEQAVTRAQQKDPDSGRLFNIKGRIYAARQQWDQAEEMFVKSLAANPDQYSSHTILFLFYQQQKKMDKARQMLQTMIERFPDNPQPRLSLAEMYIQQQDMTAAESEVKKAVEISPTNLHLRLMLSNFYKKQGKIDQAEQTLIDAQQALPDSLDLQSSIADLQFDRGKFDAARATMETILTSNDKQGGALLVKAKFLIKDTKYHKAIDILTQLTSDYPKWADPFYYTGVAHFKLNEFELAQIAVGKALQAFPSDSKYHSLLAHILWSQGNVKESRGSAATALRLNPRNFGAATLMTKIMLQEKQFASAEKILVKMVEKRPNDLNLLGNLGLAYLGLKQNDKALQTYEKLLQLSPENSRALMMLTLLSAGDDVQKATALVRQQIEKAPNSGEHRILLANLLLKANQPEEALVALQQAQQLAPELPESYFISAAIMKRLGRTDQAEAEYKALITATPDAHRAHMGLGTLYESLNRTEEAKLSYQNVLKYNPGFAPAANNLAWIIANEENGDLGEALRLAMIAKQKFPETPTITDTLGWVHYKRNSFSLARAQFEQALAVDGKNPTITYHLALTFYALQKKEKAREALTKAIALPGPFAERETAKQLLEQWANE